MRLSCRYGFLQLNTLQKTIPACAAFHFTMQSCGQLPAGAALSLATIQKSRDVCAAPLRSLRGKLEYGRCAHNTVQNRTCVRRIFFLRYCTQLNKTMNTKTLQVLEYGKIIDMLKAEAGSELTRARIAELVPMTIRTTSKTDWTKRGRRSSSSP